MNPFDNYAQELSLLVGNANPLTALLSRRDPRPADAAQAKPWRRTYARFHPHEPSYCTFLYEVQAGAEVDDAHAADAGPPPLRVSLYRDAGAAPGGDAVAGLGVVHIAPPTEDEALDTLAAVLARHAHAKIVRWRPGHRCTFRAAHAHAGTQYVKVFASSGIAPHLFAGMQALWQHRGELGFDVAQPLELDHGLRFASQAALPGVPLMGELLGPHGLDVAAAIGRAAATLPASSVGAAGADVAAEDDDTLARTDHYVRSIATLLPDVADRLRALVARLEHLEAACAPPRRLPIHGGLHSSQWLRCGGPPPRPFDRLTTGQARDGQGPDQRLGLVDFDRLSLGDPELDVATFVTELRYEGSAAVPAAQLCRAFTDAYAQTVPLDPRRVELYVAHKEVSKLMRLARQPRPDAPQRFARALERLEQAGTD